MPVGCDSGGDDGMRHDFKAQQSPVNALLIQGIVLYQRYVSPRKGWRCAYSVLHGGPGCSGAVKYAIQTHGWHGARPLARQRFRECKLAAQTLRAQADSDPARNRKREKRRRGDGSWWSCDTNWCSCLNVLFDCGPRDTGCIDCNPCDCTSCN